VGYETIAVPFKMLGNRRCLTDQQLVELPWLKEFADRFPASFERDNERHVLLFIEPK
jgi:hypothetical protein